MITNYRLSILAVIVSGCFVFGCNSHASFDNNNVNNGNCGNLSLNSNEPCDMGHNGETLLADGESCVNEGFLGGYLECTENCQLDTTHCTDPVGCNPLDPYSCNLGENVYCYYNPNEQTSNCREASSNLTEGATCLQPSDCAPGMTCYATVCHIVCTENSHCENTGVCEKYGWFNGMGVCQLPAGECNPVTGGGCSEQGYGCYLNSGLGGGKCEPAGIGITGDECGPDTDCLPGHICAYFIEPGRGFCTRLCDSDHPCNGDLGCGYYPGVQAGVCLEPAGCNDLFGGADCPDTQLCTIVNQNGLVACLLSNHIGEGQFCDMFNRCSNGLYCASEFDHQCHKVCATQQECTLPEDTCNPMTGWSFPDVNGYCTQ